MEGKEYTLGGTGRLLVILVVINFGTDAFVWKGDVVLRLTWTNGTARVRIVVTA